LYLLKIFVVVFTKDTAFFNNGAMQHPVK